MSRGATAEWPMRKDDTHNSRLFGSSMIGPKPFCESVGPQLNYFTTLARMFAFFLGLGSRVVMEGVMKYTSWEKQILRLAVWYQP